MQKSKNLLLTDIVLKSLSKSFLDAHNSCDQVTGGFDFELGYEVNDKDPTTSIDLMKQYSTDNLNFKDKLRDFKDQKSKQYLRYEDQVGQPRSGMRLTS